jgi:hypothetical protein
MVMEQREYERMSIDHPVIYTAVDEVGTTIAQGVARALDISPRGLMIETYQPITEKWVKIRATVFDDKSISIEGEMIYSIPHRPRTYRIGIKFDRAHEAVSEFIAGLRYMECALM